MKKDNNYNKKAWAVLLATSMATAPVNVSAARNFTDMPTDWSRVPIEKAIEKGFIKGYDDNSIRPHQNITRAEFVAMINRIEKYERKEDISHFEDVSKSDWFYEDIGKGYAAGIITGISDSQMNPQGEISREEAFSIIARSKNIKSSKDRLSEYIDGNEASDWSREYLNGLIEEGLIEGHGNKKLTLKDNITRAETAALLVRVSAFQDDINAGNLEEIEEFEKEVLEALKNPYIEVEKIDELLDIYNSMDLETREKIRNKENIAKLEEKKALLEASQKIGNLKEEDYTEASFEKVAEAHDRAETILENTEENEVAEIREAIDKIEKAIDELVFKSELGGIDLEKPSEDKEEDREAGKIEIADKEVNALLEKYEKEIREQIDIAPLREIEKRFNEEAKFEEEHKNYLETVVDQVLADIYFKDGIRFNGLLEQVDLENMDVKYVGELISYYNNDMSEEARKFVDEELLEKVEVALLEKIANLEKANEIDIKVLSLLKDSDAEMEVMIELIEEYNSLKPGIKEKVNTVNVEKLDEKIALLEASQKIGNLKEEDYTEASFEKVAEAHDRAETILENTQENEVAEIREAIDKIDKAIDELVFKSELGGIDLEKPSEDKEEDREAGKIEIADKEVNALLEKYEKEIREQIDIAPLRKIENRFHSEAKFAEEHVEYLETVVDQVLAEIYFRDGNSFNMYLEKVNKDFSISLGNQLIDYYNDGMPKEAKKFVDVELLENIEDRVKEAEDREAGKIEIADKEVNALLEKYEKEIREQIDIAPLRKIENRFHSEAKFAEEHVEYLETVVDQVLAEIYFRDGNSFNMYLEKVNKDFSISLGNQLIDYYNDGMPKEAKKFVDVELLEKIEDRVKEAEDREAGKIEIADKEVNALLEEYEKEIREQIDIAPLRKIENRFHSEAKFAEEHVEYLETVVDQVLAEIYFRDGNSFNGLLEQVDLKDMDIKYVGELIDYYSNDMPKEAKKFVDVELLEKLEDVLLEKIANLEKANAMDIKVLSLLKDSDAEMEVMIGLIEEYNSLDIEVKVKVNAENIEKLDEKIALLEASHKIGNLKEEDYTEASFEKVAEAHDRAETILENTQENEVAEIREAINKIEKAIDGLVTKDQAETEAIIEYETAIVKAESLNDLDVLREKINADERLGQEPKEDLNESLDIKEELLRKEHFEEIYKQDAENFDALVKDLLEEMDLERALDLIDYYNNDMPKQSKSMIDENALFNLEGKVKDETKEIKELKEELQGLVNELTLDPVVASKQEVIKVVDEALRAKNNEKASKEELQKVINELEKTKKLMDLHKRIFAVKEDGNYLIENPNILGQLNIEFNELNREETLVLKEAHVRLSELNDLYQKAYNNKLEAELIRSKDEAKRDLLSYVNNKYPEYRDAINKDSHVKSHIEAGLNLIDQAEASGEIEGIVSDKKKLIDLRAKEILSEKAKEEAEYKKLKEEAEAAIKKAEEAKKKAEEDYNKHVEGTEAPELDKEIIDDWDSGIVEEGENGWDQVAEDVAILEAANEMDIKVLSLLEDEDATIEEMTKLIDEYKELKAEVKEKVNTENVDKLDAKLAAAIKEAEYKKLKEEAEEAVKKAEEAKKKAEEDYSKHVEETEAPELDEEVEKDMTHEDTSEKDYQKAMEEKYAEIAILEAANEMDIKVLSLLEDEDATKEAMEELLDEYDKLEAEVKEKVKREKVEELKEKLEKQTLEIIRFKNFKLDDNGKIKEINFDKEYLEVSKAILNSSPELREDYYTDDLVLVRIDIYKKTGIFGMKRTLIENQEYVVPRELLAEGEIKFNMGETYADEEGKNYKFDKASRNISLYKDLNKLKNGGKSKEKFVYSFNLKK